MRDCFVLAFVIAATVAMTCADRKINIKEVDYHGWPAIIMSNGMVEAVVVPVIGRVMQFRFAGEEEGPFWENRLLDGKTADARSRQWANFGGDKAWPAQQSDWPSVTNRGWPPPATFDSLPLLPQIKGDTVELISAVDPFYGIRFRRLLQLDPSKPVLTITTEYEKVDGQPVKAAIWIITQLKEPLEVRIPLEGISQKPPYNNQGRGDLPQDFKVDSDAVTLTRNPKTSHKIGSYGESLVWVGTNVSLEIHSERQGGDYPDHGSSTEVYTNLDPLKYVELEMLGPIRTMKPGERLKQKSRYTLRRQP